MDIRDFGQNSYSVARSLINQAHLSCICTETQITPRFYSTNYKNLLILATMGLAIICEALKDAVSIQFGSPSVRSHEAIVFIQGTGLELTIQRFSLDLDADSIRKGFNYITHAS